MTTRDRPLLTSYFIAPWHLLLFAVVVKCIATALFIAWGLIPLGPDEAQYWTWSQQLALGYYSKPPAIAWQIALGTKLFGNTEFGVRAGALVLGSVLPIAIYALARSCQLATTTALLAALAMAFSPFGMLSSMLAITDGGMVLCWTLSAALFCRAISYNKPLPYYSIALTIACGALFKWPAYTFWIPVIAWLIYQPALFNRHLWGGLLLSLGGLLPSLLWNMQHAWPTFKHVSATIYTAAPPTEAASHGNFWEFVAMQALLLFPLSFLLLLYIGVKNGKSWKKLPPALLFCFATTTCFILSFATAALFKKIQGNWCDFVLPLGFVITAWGCCEWRPALQKWLITSGTMSALLILCVPLMTPLLKQNVGGPQLGNALLAAGYEPTKHFLFADKYQTCSLLSFYGAKQKRAYFLNLCSIRNNQFSFWPGMEVEQKGATGFFVCQEHTPHLERHMATQAASYHTLLEPYFESVECLGLFPLFHSKDGRLIKACYIFKCSRYNGQLPKPSPYY